MVTGIVDLRSDTVTRPTPAMREAMAGAEVGDDVLDGDPTTRALEERVAALLGKERALFFPSGIQANQTALAILGRPGTEVVLEAEAHIFHYEEAAGAVLSGLQLRPLATPDGILRAGRVEEALRTKARYSPQTSLVAVENTHNSAGGKVMPLETARDIARVAWEAGVLVHLDGARLWNACVASGNAPKDYAATADTVMVSLSKGLGAPVGSLLAGSGDLMERAWRVRRRLGGAMRQSGILAAAGLFALEHHLPRLEKDHRRARILAAGWAQLPGIQVQEPETNIVMADVVLPGVGAQQVVEALGKEGVRVVPFGPRRIRAVTHLDVDDEGVEVAVAAMGRALARCAQLSS